MEQQIAEIQDHMNRIQEDQSQLDQVKEFFAQLWTNPLSTIAFYFQQSYLKGYFALKVPL